MSELKVNTHHLYFERKRWNSMRLSNQIRNLDRSQVLLPIELHADLHANTSPMAIPSAFVARVGLERILSMKRSYKTLDVAKDTEDFMRSIGENYHDDATEIANKLSEQIPYIQLGVDSLKRRHIA